MSKSATTVRIAGLNYESIVDGPGIRTTVFFQGCPHACAGCHNPQTWDPEGGRELSWETVISKLKLNPLVNGVTFSGGEPFRQAESAAKLGVHIKNQGLGLWIYTGFTWEQLLANLENPGYRQLIALADVIVDGPYLKELKQLDLPFRGSSNQRLIEVGTSLAQGTIVEWQPMKVES